MTQISTQIPQKIFQDDHMVLGLWKKGEEEYDWIDHGRGSLRCWKKEDTGQAWFSMISPGTKRELLTRIEYRGDVIDNRILIRTTGGIKTDFKFLNIAYEEGIVVKNGLKCFLFRALRSRREEEEVVQGEDQDQQPNENDEGKNGDHPQISAVDEKDDKDKEQDEVRNKPEQKASHKTRIADKLLEILRKEFPDCEGNESDFANVLTKSFDEE